jgi:flavin reductase (DIM6/NTAB) family NADH-FMN oxidoreductase RutF
MILTINRDSSTWRAIQRREHFCVNVLANWHEAVAERFTGHGGIDGPDRYAGAEWVTLATGAAVLADALAAVDCTLEAAFERHSHAIVIGRVEAVRCGRGDALLYGHGIYSGHDAAARRPQ